MKTEAPNKNYTISFSESQMPQYPFEQERITDEVEYRTKSGKVFRYRNYLKRSFKFSWTNLDESKRDELADMVDQIPIFSFKSGGNDFGTFVLMNNSVDDEETSFELYDFSFVGEEAE